MIIATIVFLIFLLLKIMRSIPVIVLVRGSMNIYQIISIIGLSSILTVVGLIYIREKSLRLGVQALLRAEMINDYYKYM